MNPYHTPYRQLPPVPCCQPICERQGYGERVQSLCVYGQPPALQQPTRPSYPMTDPSSRSSVVTGAVANGLVAIPFIGGIFGIIFGLIAVRRARRGRLAVESSAHGLRGKGAYIAGRIMGWSAFGAGIFMLNYYLVLLVVIAANR